MRKILFPCTLWFIFSFISGNPMVAQNKNKSNATGTNQSINVGSHHAGGVVFWIEPGNAHGLIAAPSDCPGKGFAWNPGSEKITMAKVNEVYGGEKNTETILRIQGTGSESAARYCQDLVVTDQGKTYSDWYLPCRHELNLMFRSRATIGGFNTNNGIYWSSTESGEFPGTMAWEQEFKYGTQLEDDKDLPNQVRCIRKF